MGCNNSNVNEDIPENTIKKNVRNSNSGNVDPNDKTKICSPQNKVLESKDSKQIKNEIVNKQIIKQMISLNPINNTLSKEKEDFNFNLFQNLPNNKLKKKLRYYPTADKKIKIKKLDFNREEDKENNSSYGLEKDSSYYLKDMQKEETTRRNNVKLKNSISSVNSSELSSDSNEIKNDINNNVVNENKGKKEEENST